MIPFHLHLCAGDGSTADGGHPQSSPNGTSSGLTTNDGGTQSGYSLGDNPASLPVSVPTYFSSSASSSGQVVNVSAPCSLITGSAMISYNQGHIFSGSVQGNGNAVQGAIAQGGNITVQTVPSSRDVVPIKLQVVPSRLPTQSGVAAHVSPPGQQGVTAQVISTRPGVNTPTRSGGMTAQTTSTGPSVAAHVNPPAQVGVTARVISTGPGVATHINTPTRSGMTAQTTSTGPIVAAHVNPPAQFGVTARVSSTGPGVATHVNPPTQSSITAPRAAHHTQPQTRWGPTSHLAPLGGPVGGHDEFGKSVTNSAAITGLQESLEQVNLVIYKNVTLLKLIIFFLHKIAIDKRNTSTTR